MSTAQPERYDDEQIEMMRATDPPATTWPDRRPPTLLDSEAPYVNVYMVIEEDLRGRGVIGLVSTDRNEAHEYARISHGIVARLPVVGDYRDEG